MRIFFLFFLTVLLLSCNKEEEVVTDPSIPIRLSADVRMYKPNGGFLYWYTMIYSSRAIKAKTYVTVEWQTTDANGQVLKTETYKATINADQPSPAVEKTATAAQPAQGTTAIRILSVKCDNPALKFDY